MKLTTYDRSASALVNELTFSFALSTSAAKRISECVNHDRAKALALAQIITFAGVGDDELEEALLDIRTKVFKYEVPHRRIGVLCPCGFAWNPPVVDTDDGPTFEACPRCGQTS